MLTTYLGIQKPGILRAMPVIQARAASYNFVGRVIAGNHPKHGFGFT